jgi:hypothetical protein
MRMSLLLGYKTQFKDLKMNNEAKAAYDDWIKLLKDAKALDMLQDPYGIWLEAWEQARITASSNSKT